ncbi:MAG: cellulase family glycosylhydrolase [Alphaproteobacteria bacterium]|nr:cellulase family glycosylhydrolase [Alphaproteobacteria bacterium]
MTVDRRTFAAGAAALLGAGALGGDPAGAQIPGGGQPAPGRGVRLPASPVMKFRRGIAIGNALEASYEGEWGYTIQRRHLEAIKRAGFDHVRLPVKFSGHLEAAPPFTIDPKFMLRLDEILRWMIEIGLICIIDVHHFDNISERPDIHEPRLIAIWRQVASRYAHLPNSIVFEVINEPRGLLIGERLRKMYRAVLAEIRPLNPTRPVILSGDRWGNSIGLPALMGMDDPYVIATFHYYAPGNFTHQGAWWDKNQSPKMGVKWGTAADVAKVKADIALAASRAQPLGMPVFLGEFGVINTIPDTERAPWIRTVRRAAEQHGMSWCIWQFVVSGHMYDLKTDTWSAPIYQALFDRPPPRPALASR